MSWSREASSERIAAHLESMGEIEIAPLERDADLDSVLSERSCREIDGPHVYAEISNYAGIVSDMTGDELRKAIRGLHIFQRQVTSIVEEVFDGVRVHFQGARLHALFYRPAHDHEALAVKAVLLALVVDDFASSVLNPKLPSLPSFQVRSGADIGTVIGTKNGVRGDRELLFVGSPANEAAKLLAGKRRAMVTERLIAALPESIAQYVVEDAVGSRVQVTPAQLDALLEEYGYTYKRTHYADRVDLDLRQFALKDIEYSGAREKIRFSALSIYNNKRIAAASLFADIDGFTAYVEEATTTDLQKGRLRVFAAIRKELALVAKRDFDGIRVQYQGDRTQALYHLPEDETEKIYKEAVSAAAAMQSSFEITLKDALPEAKPLKLAIGIDFGTTIASQLGARGQRDRICIGNSVDNAAAIQEACDGDEIGISDVVFNNIPASWQKLFEYDKRRDFYVAKGLRYESLKLAELGESFDKKNVYISTAGSTVAVSSTSAPGSRAVQPSRSWGK
jgi:class 3 adenylate cyclase